MRFRPLHDRVVVKRIEAEEKSAGMPIYGTLALTRMRPGTAPVSSHGNSGLLRVTTLGS
jgi:co-chaperonin GroES (HSP10)